MDGFNEDALMMLRDISESMLRIEVRMSNMESWLKQMEEERMAADVLTREQLETCLARAQQKYNEISGIHPEAERRRDELRKRIALLRERIRRAEVADYEEEVIGVIRNEG